MKNSDEVIIRAFPKVIKDDVLKTWEKIKIINEFQISDCFTISVNGENLEIPHRIYEIPYGVSIEELGMIEFSANEFLILNCLLSRHHNGFIRQKHLKHILKINDYWITPFIFQLLGEYVVEILNEINENLNDNLLKNFARFADENPIYFNITKSRVTSYWNCYYRRHSSKKTDYVGFQIISKIEEFRTK